MVHFSSSKSGQFNWFHIRKWDFRNYFESCQRVRIPIIYNNHRPGVSAHVMMDVKAEDLIWVYDKSTAACQLRGS